MRLLRRRSRVIVRESENAVFEVTIMKDDALVCYREDTAAPFALRGKRFIDGRGQKNRFRIYFFFPRHPYISRFQHTFSLVICKHINLKSFQNLRLRILPTVFRAI